MMKIKNLVQPLENGTMQITLPPSYTVRWDMSQLTPVAHIHRKVKVFGESSSTTPPDLPDGAKETEGAE